MLQIDLFRVLASQTPSSNLIISGQNKPLHQRVPHRQGEHRAARLRQSRARVRHPQRRGQRGLQTRAAEASHHNHGRGENCDRFNMQDSTV